MRRTPALVATLLAAGAVGAVIVGSAVVGTRPAAACSGIDPGCGISAGAALPETDLLGRLLGAKPSPGNKAKASRSHAKSAARQPATHVELRPMVTRPQPYRVSVGGQTVLVVSPDDVTDLDLAADAVRVVAGDEVNEIDLTAPPRREARR